MAQSNLKYLKGVRTRYFNTLEEEVQLGETLMECTLEEIPSEDYKSFQKRVSENKLKIDAYIDKLNNQSEKLAQAVGDTDDNLIDLIINEDSKLLNSASAVFCQLRLRETELQELIKQKDEKLKKSFFSESDESAVHKMCETQMKLQQEFFEKQQQFSESQKNKSSKNVVKLPKLEMKSFGGKQLEWSEFWDAFESSVHNNDQLSPVDKFNYLRGKLFGEARHSVAGLSLSNANYEVAVRILRERFGNTDDIIDLHYKKLVNIPAARNNTESLRFFMDSVERHLRSLQVLKENVDQHVFVSMILSKLPSDVLLQLEIMKGADNKWTIRKLRDLLRQYIVSKEKAERNKTPESAIRREDKTQRVPPSNHLLVQNQSRLQEL